MSTESKKTFKLRNELLKREGVQTYNPNTKLYYVSASQISDFRRCKKRWYHKVVDKVKEPDKASAALGSAVHSFIERAIVGEFPEGFPENVRAIALSGQRFWPGPETDMEIEREFVLQDPDVPLPMYGFIDVRTDNEVIDHKTTSNIAQYGKVAEQWQNDPQGIIYPAANLSLGGKPRFRIIYYQTRGRASSEVVVDMTPGQIRFGLQEIGRDVEEMLRLSKLPLVDVPHNEQACGDYGGCYMRNLCARVGVVPSNVGAYAEVWAALYQSPDQSQQSAAPSGENTKEKEMSMSEALSYRERMLAQRAAAAAKAASLSDPESEEGGAPAPATAAAATPVPVVAPTINPPDGVSKSPATKEELEQVMATVAPVTAAPAEDDDDDDTPPAPVSRGRGRPAGAKNRATVTGVVAAAIVEEPQVVSAVIDVAPPVIDVTSGDVSAAEKQVFLLEAELSSAKAAEADADKKAKTLRTLAMDGDDEALEKLPAAKKKAADAVAAIETIGAQLSKAKKTLADAIAAETKRRDETRKAAEAEAASRIVSSVIYAAAPEQIVVAPSGPVVVAAEGASRSLRVMYLGCSPEKDTAGLVHFDDWIQQFARRAESARQTPYYRMLPHNAVDAVVAEILADLRSGAQQPPAKLVFRRFSAQYFQYAQDLRPFYDEVIS